MFCVSCGKPIDDGSLFCEHCGAKQNNDANSVPNNMGNPIGSPMDFSMGNPMMNQVQSVPKKPMDPKTKMILMIVGGLVVAFFLLKTLLGSMNAPEKTIDKFLEGIRNQDVGAVEKVVTISLDLMEKNEENLEPFVKGYSQDSKALMDFRQDLMEDLKEINMTGIAEGNGFMKLVKSSNFLYDSYKIELIPQDVYVSTSVWFDVDAIIGPQHLTIPAKEDCVITVLPGVYEGTAHADTFTGVPLDMTFTNLVISPENGRYINIPNAKEPEGGSVRMDYEGVVFDFDYNAIGLEYNHNALDFVSIAIDDTVILDKNSPEYEIYEPLIKDGVNFGPLPDECKITVVSEAYGMELVDEINYPDNTYYRIDMRLPEEAKNSALELGKEIGQAYCNVRMHLDTEGQKVIANSDNVTENAKKSVSDWVASFQANIGNYDTYIFANGPVTIDDLSLKDIRYNDGYISARVYYKEKGIYNRVYALTNEAYSTYYTNYNSSCDCSVYLEYRDGAWQVVDFRY